LKKHSASEIVHAADRCAACRRLTAGNWRRALEPNTLTAYPFLDVAWLQAIFTIMSSAGSIVFANLSVLFAVGVAVGLAKSDKGRPGWRRCWRFW
jgi:hypothetical protein